MSTNQELLQQAGGILDSMGVQKSDIVMTTANTQVGQFMDRAQVERLVDLTVSQSGWLSAVSVKMRQQRAGEIPRMVINGVVTEGVPENGGKTIATRATTDNVEYNCKKFQATWFLTLEDIREARASGEPDFDPKVRRAFAKAMGNDMARWALNGNTLLDTSTRLNRLLRQRDGWLKKARALANSFTTTRGSAFDKTLFFAMQAQMPEEFRDDADLRWFMPSILDIAWTSELADPTNAQGSALGDAALTKRRRFEPLGIPQLLINQLPTQQGFAVVNGSTSDADAIVDNAGANLTATVDTMFGGFNAVHVGRQITITFPGTGEVEKVTVINDGGALKVITTGTLGQGSISTTPGDYTLDLADITTAILTNPRNLFLVMCDRIRAYRKWEQEAERWRIDVFYEADAGLFNEDAMVIQDGIIAPTFSFGS